MLSNLNENVKLNENLKLNDNVKHNTYKGRTIDKESKEIAYFDDTHEYIDKKDGVKGVSVTTLIHSYSNPFDALF